MKICEDISNCDISENEPVSVINNYSNERPDAFTYTDKLIFRFDVNLETNEKVKFIFLTINHF